MPSEISDLIRPVEVFPPQEKGKMLNAFFDAKKDSEGVVVMDNESIVGIIMRNAFYQKLGHQYGYSLYYNRPVTILMKKDILKIDAGCTLAQLGMLAMSRSSENLYDFIVVEDEAGYHGVISIRNFLIEMTKLKERELELLKLQNDREIQYRKDLVRRNICIKSLLDNTGQGFFNFGEDLNIADEYSRECVDILELVPGGMKADQLFAQILEKNELEETMEIILSAFNENDENKFMVYLSLMPGEIVIHGRYIRFEYKLIMVEDKRQIMVIMTDITEKLVLEKQMMEEKKNLKLIIKSITATAEIKQAMDSLSEYLEQINLKTDENLNDDDMDEILRQIHTYKGDFAQLSMYNTADKLHSIENKLYELAGNKTEKLTFLHSFIVHIEPKDLFNEDKAIIFGILGNDYLEKDDYLNLSLERLETVERRLTDRFGEEHAADIESIMSSLKYVSLKKAIMQYDDYIQTLAERLDKKISPVAFSGGDVYMDKMIYYHFLKSLVHIFRNIIDHGIEYPDERTAQGKSVFGSIKVNIKIEDDQEILLRIEDDGRGIDCAQVKEKAIQKGLLTDQQASGMPREQVYELLFENRFSTKETANVVSGRGVGLSAVRTQVENKGGKIRIISETGMGTAFEIRLPVNPANIDATVYEDRSLSLSVC